MKRMKELLLVSLFLFTSLIVFAGGQPEPPSETSEPVAAEHAEACISCHTKITRSFGNSVHAGTLTREPAVSCASCHKRQARKQASTEMLAAGVTCTDCHMPTVSAGDGTFQTHQTTIDPGQIDIPEGDAAGVPRTAFGLSCKSCHGAPGGTTDLSDTQLIKAATHYHGKLRRR